MKGKKTIDWSVDENGCWICTSHAAYPYPETKRHGIKTQMARMIYEECFGFIPDKMVLRHKCNNKLCINPEHLTTGTDSDNFHDREGKDTWPAGEKNGAHKLTTEQVKQIRAHSVSVRPWPITRKGIRRIEVPYHRHSARTILESGMTPGKREETA